MFEMSHWTTSKKFHIKAHIFFKAIIQVITLMADESDDQSCYESETSQVSDKIVKQKKLRKKFNTPATSKATSPRKRKPTANHGKY